MSSDELDLTLNFISHYPHAAAREIEKQSVESAMSLLNLLPQNQASTLLFQLMPAFAAKLVKRLPQENCRELLVDAQAEQLSAILRYLDNAEKDLVISQLPQKIATLCHLLLNYTQDTVGAWMIADILMLPLEINVSEALLIMANSKELFVADTLPVVDADKHLVGLISLKQLFVANRETQLKQLLKKNAITLKSRASLTSVAEDNSWFEFDVLCVLNRNQQVVGMLRHLDLRQSLQSPIESQEMVETDKLVTLITKTYFNSLGALFGLVFNNDPKDSPLVKSEKQGR